MSKARLYYEAHVTVEARETENDWMTFKMIASNCGWRASKFSEDEVDDYHGKWFLSWRGEELEDTTRAVRAMVSALLGGGYIVIRWKVEDTLLDSKHGDLPEILDTSLRRELRRHRDCDHTLSGSSPSGDKICVTCGDVFDHTGDFVRATRYTLVREEA